MKPVGAFVVLAGVAAIPMAGQTTRTVQVTSGSVELRCWLESDPNIIDPNVMTTTSALSGTFTVTIDQAGETIGEGDTFRLGEANLLNAESMSLSIYGLATASVAAGDARFLDFDRNDNDVGSFDAKGVGSITTESYVEATIDVSGLLSTTFSTRVWSDAMPWTIRVVQPATYLLTLTACDPGCGVVIPESVGAPVSTTFLSGAHHLEFDVPEIGATCNVDIVAEAQGSTAAALSHPCYLDGSQVKLTAVLKDAYDFLYWEGDVPDGRCSSNPLTITMDRSKAVKVVYGSRLVLTVGASPTSVVFGESATVTASADGGIGPYAYEWGTGQTTPCIVVTPHATTEYSVTVTDGQGHQAHGSATVFVAGDLQVIVTASRSPILSGDAITLTAVTSGGTPPYSCVWNTGQSGGTVGIRPSQTTTYTVTATDARGRTAQGELTVTVATTLIISVTAEVNPIALGGSTTLAATVSGGAEPYAFTWNTGESSDRIVVAPTATTTYTVTVRDAVDQIAQAALPVTVTSGSIAVDTYRVTVSVIGPGTVRQTPPGRSVFEAGERVTLEAVPLAATGQFLGWQGAVTSKESEITLSVNGDTQIAAAFANGGPQTSGGSCFAPFLPLMALVTWTAARFASPRRRGSPNRHDS